MLGRPPRLWSYNRGAPAFSIVRTAFAGKRLVQMRRSLVRGDRAQFRVQLAGRSLGVAGGEVAPRIELPELSQRTDVPRVIDCSAAQTLAAL
jgi:hypothetical protein